MQINVDSGAADSVAAPTHIPGMLKKSENQGMYYIAAGGAKIQNIKRLTLGEASRLKDKISEVGWSMEENRTLSALIDEALAKSTRSRPCRRCSQDCSSWELYPSLQEWGFMKDPHTPWKH